MMDSSHSWVCWLLVVVVLSGLATTQSPAPLAPQNPTIVIEKLLPDKIKVTCYAMWGDLYPYSIRLQNEVTGRGFKVLMAHVQSDSECTATIEPLSRAYVEATSDCVIPLFGAFVPELPSPSAPYRGLRMIIANISDADYGNYACTTSYNNPDIADIYVVARALQFQTPGLRDENHATYRPTISLRASEYSDLLTYACELPDAAIIGLRQFRNNTPDELYSGIEAYQDPSLQLLKQPAVFCVDKKCVGGDAYGRTYMPATTAVRQNSEHGYYYTTNMQCANFAMQTCSSGKLPTDYDCVDWGMLATPQDYYDLKYVPTAVEPTRGDSHAFFFTEPVSGRKIGEKTFVQMMARRVPNVTIGSMHGAKMRHFVATASFMTDYVSHFWDLLAMYNEHDVFDTNDCASHPSCTDYPNTLCTEYSRALTACGSLLLCQLQFSGQVWCYDTPIAYRYEYGSQCGDTTSSIMAVAQWDCLSDTLKALVDNPGPPSYDDTLGFKPYVWSVLKTTRDFPVGDVYMKGHGCHANIWYCFKIMKYNRTTDNIVVLPRPTPPPEERVIMSEHVDNLYTFFENTQADLFNFIDVSDINVAIVGVIKSLLNADTISNDCGGDLTFDDNCPCVAVGQHPNEIATLPVNNFLLANLGQDFYKEVTCVALGQTSEPKTNLRLLSEINDCTLLAQFKSALPSPVISVARRSISSFNVKCSQELDDSCYVGAYRITVNFAWRNGTVVDSRVYDPNLLYDLSQNRHYWDSVFCEYHGKRSEWVDFSDVEFYLTSDCEAFHFKTRLVKTNCAGSFCDVSCGVDYSSPGCQAPKVYLDVSSDSVTCYSHNHNNSDARPDCLYYPTVKHLIATLYHVPVYNPVVCRLHGFDNNAVFQHLNVVETLRAPCEQNYILNELTVSLYELNYRLVCEFPPYNFDNCTDQLTETIYPVSVLATVTYSDAKPDRMYDIMKQGSATQSPRCILNTECYGPNSFEEPSLLAFSADVRLFIKFMHISNARSVTLQCFTKRHTSNSIDLSGYLNPPVLTTPRTYFRKAPVVKKPHYVKPLVTIGPIHKITHTGVILISVFTALTGAIIIVGVVCTCVRMMEQLKKSKQNRLI